MEDFILRIPWSTQCILAPITAGNCSEVKVANTNSQSAVAVPGVPQPRLFLGDVPNYRGASKFRCLYCYESQSFPCPACCIGNRCGDHLHPNDAGYLHMGDGIDLGLFDQ
jgi:hypothetical protein